MQEYGVFRTPCICLCLYTPLDAGPTHDMMMSIGLDL